MGRPTRSNSLPYTHYLGCLHDCSLVSRTRNGRLVIYQTDYTRSLFTTHPPGL